MDMDTETHCGIELSYLQFDESRGDGDGGGIKVWE